MPVWIRVVGYHAIASPDSFGTSTRAVEEEVAKKVDIYANRLAQSAEEYRNQGVLHAISFF